jgi:hypothetical protein
MRCALVKTLVHSCIHERTSASTPAESRIVGTQNRSPATATAVPNDSPNANDLDKVQP